jgi:alkylation response protein AidB-like acyl-CoA dehydrogenase
LLIEDVADWAVATESPDGGCVADTPWVQIALGEACARVEALKVLNWRMAWGIEQGKVDAALASAVKVYGTETVIEIYRLLMDVLGVTGTLQKGSPGALLEGRIEEAWRGAPINTYGGGVNEVQRSLVASLGLRMPRTGR